jgi:hypothetical protein
METPHDRWWLQDEVGEEQLQKLGDSADFCKVHAVNIERCVGGICVGSWTGRMTDSEGEQVVTCQVTEEWMRLRQEFLLP